MDKSNMDQPAVRKVAVFSIANPEHAIASLRLITPLSEAGIENSWRMPNQEYEAELLSDCDLVIIQRDFPRFVHQYIQIHSDAYRLGIPVIFEIDDLLWELPEEHPDRATNHYTDALLPMMFAAWASDGITVASPGIKDYLSWLNPNIYLLPNYLNPKLWDFQNPELTKGNTITIGYMGGDSHLPDFQMIETAILNILERFQGRVKFITWGLKPAPALKDHPLVEWNSLTPGDYAAFTKYFNQQEFDIYISPLKDSLFNRCKSSIKILEYTALGIPGVSSDLEPYRNVINPGVTGFLAETTEQWEEHLTTLIDQPETRLQIAKKAQISIRKDWLISDHFYQWQQVYESVVSSYSQRKDVPHILQVMKTILTQTTEHKKQLMLKFDDQQAQLSQLKASRSWRAGQMLKSIYKRIFSNEQKASPQKVLDEP
jgi:glycosyltransferase involved in cell wall biosynthesis